MLEGLKARLRTVSRRGRSELDEELAFHLECEAAVHRAAGMSEGAARRQAAIAFGGVEGVRARAWEQRPGYWLEVLAQDARYALRGFRRSPVFTLTLIATLMLGIGTTTAVFSVVDRILFRPLPYGDGGRLVSVGLVAPIEPQEFMLGSMYYAWQDGQTPFTAMTSETGVTPCDLTEGTAARLHCATVEANFLPTLGVRPLLGRNFTAEEDKPNAPRVALLSYALWKSRFGANRGLIDRLIEIDGSPVRVIGVLPASFEMPRLQAMDVMLPEALDAAAQRRSTPGRVLWGFARLKPGVSAEQAKAALEPLFRESSKGFPPQFLKEIQFEVRSLRDRQVHDVRATGWVLLATALAVLLIACANMASLLLARALLQERETAVRAALGASRQRLIAQGLMESALLAAAGGLAGIALAEGLLRVFVAIAPAGITFLEQARVDLRILGFTVGLTAVCGLISGVVPALSRPRAEALAGRSAKVVGHARLRQGLVVVQLGVSLILLAGGALLCRSFWNLERQPLGLRAERLVTTRIVLGQKSYANPEQQMMFFADLERRLRYSPGVTGLALSDTLPPGGDHHDQIYASLVVPGHPREGGTGGTVAWRWVSPEYFRLLGIPMLRGAGFTEEERSSKGHFVVISRMLAGRLFPGQEAVGQRIQVAGGGAGDPFYTVVGVTADVKNGGIADTEEPEYYRLRRRQAEDWDGTSAIVVRTNLPADAITREIQGAVSSIDASLPVDVETFSSRISKLADAPRFQTLLVVFFAVSGLALALIGLYGVLSFLVTQRRQEIGVRMALGAGRSDVLRLVLRDSLRLVGMGLALGLLLASLLSRLLRTLLFHVGSHDAVCFCCAIALTMLVAILATILPARSAMEVDPMDALRHQ